MANLSNINNKFLVTTGGNVLIGQTSAVGSSILQVTGNSTFAGNILFGTDGTYDIGSTSGSRPRNVVVSNSIAINTSTGAAGTLNVASTGTFGGKVQVNKAKSGTGVENYDLIRLNLTGTGAIGDSSTIAWHSTNGTKTAGIEGISGLDNIAYGELAFSTRRYTTDTYLEAMRINNRGNVGIGVTGPVTKLELPGSLTNSSLKVGTVETQSYSVNNAWISDNLYYDGSFKLRSAGYASQIYFGVSNGGADISFKRYPTGNAGDVVTGVTSLQLLGDGDVYIPGNVGIGTDSPRDKLTIFTPGSTKEEIALRLVNPVGFGPTGNGGAGSGSSIIFAQDRNTGENIPMAKIRNSQSATGTSCCGELIFSTAHSSFGGMIDKIQISSSGATTFKGAERPQIYLTSRYDYPNNPTFEANTFAIVAAKYIGTAPYEANRIVASNSTHLAFEAGSAERMRISNSGNITKPNSCAFSASTTAPGFLVTSTDSKITYNTENVDTNGNYDPTLSRFTAPVTGSYLIGTTNTCYISSVVNTYMAVYIVKNGSGTSYRFRGGGVDNDVNDWFGINGSVIIPLAQGDYIELFGYTNTGSFQIVNTEGHFYGYLIG